MTGNGATFFNDIAADVAQAQQRDGERVVSDLKDRVSIPVGYAIGPNGGTRIIRSKPGESPRRETGRLQASIEAETIEAGEQVATAVTVGAQYAERLQERLDRPITDDELDAVEDLILDNLVTAVQGG